jgi:hypothetical protein
MTNKPGNCRCKMAGTGTGIHTLAKLLSSNTAVCHNRNNPFKCTADCQAPRSSSKIYLRPGQSCGNPLSNLDYCLLQSAVRSFYLWQSTFKTPQIAAIRGTHLSAELSKSSSRFLTRDFSVLKLIRGRLFRPKLTTNCLSWHIVS